MSSHTWERFPTDEFSLALLEAACNVNPDSGHTELGRFLDLGTVVKSVTMNGIVYDSVEEALADAEDDDAPILDVEHEEGSAPHSPHTVIISLIEEIRRLREASNQDRDPAKRPSDD